MHISQAHQAHVLTAPTPYADASHARVSGTKCTSRQSDVRSFLGSQKALSCSAVGPQQSVKVCQLGRQVRDNFP